MSYILDALKKSEAERSHTRSVSLLDRTNNTPHVASKFVILLALILLLNAIFLGIWLVQWNTAERDSRSMQSVSLSSSDTLQPVLPSTESKPAEPVEPRLEQPRQVPAPQRIPFNQLTSTQQKNFPELEISTHVYATDPDLRAIVANGKRVVEGGAINNTIKLISITEDGIVVDYQGIQVIIPVLQEWE